MIWSIYPISQTSFHATKKEANGQKSIQSELEKIQKGEIDMIFGLRAFVSFIFPFIKFMAY